MKTNFLSITICTIIALSLYAGKANGGTTTSGRDTVCCAPDSLKVVSINYPVFCVSWKVNPDSSCKTPYGFEVQWRHYPGSFPWTGKIMIYTGGTIINFCDSVDSCGGFQWRVRTICDTLNGGTYSDWVYGNKFSMPCGGHFQKKVLSPGKPGQSQDKPMGSLQALKPKEN
jgi:hypothetical protein